MRGRGAGALRSWRRLAWVTAGAFLAVGGVACAAFDSATTDPTGAAPDGGPEGAPPDRSAPPPAADGAPSQEACEVVYSEGFDAGADASSQGFQVNVQPGASVTVVDNGLRIAMGPSTAGLKARLQGKLAAPRRLRMTASVRTVSAAPAYVELLMVYQASQQIYVAQESTGLHLYAGSATPTGSRQTLSATAKVLGLDVDLVSREARMTIDSVPYGDVLPALAFDGSELDILFGFAFAKSPSSGGELHFDDLSVCVVR